MTKEAFEAEWWKLVQSGISYIHAYNQLEEWHLKTFGDYRYASYKSFASIRNRK